MKFMRVKTKGPAYYIACAVFSVLIFGGIGLNLYKLCAADFKEPYKTEIIRVVGLLPPVGAVVGWMDIGEEI